MDLPPGQSLEPVPNTYNEKNDYNFNPDIAKQNKDNGQPYGIQPPALTKKPNSGGSRRKKSRRPKTCRKRKRSVRNSRCRRV